MVLQDLGSVGSARLKTCSKVRAAASRAVSGSPRSQVLRSVAISEVCRYSSLNTEPGSTQGETMIAGTRYPERSKVKPNSPSGTAGSGGGTGAGGTWSYVPPGSSQPISRAVFHTFAPVSEVADR